MPAAWPQLPPPAELDAATGYADTARRVITPVRRRRHRAGRPRPAVRRGLRRRSATRPSSRSSRSTTRQWLAELFHGPTLSFKDVALQLVGRLFDHVLGGRGERVTIVGATSGDTGSAAIEAVRGCAPRRHRDPVPARRGERGAAPADDDRRRPQRARRRGRGHVRRLPGPRQGDVQRRPVPRADAAGRGQLDQLGAGDGADRVLRHDGPGARRPDHGLRADGQLRQHLRRMGRPPDGDARSPTSSSPPTPTTSSPASSSRARCRWRTVVPTLSPAMDIQVSSNFERMLWVINDGNGARTGEQLAPVPRDRAPRARARAARPLDPGRVPGRPLDRRGDARRDPRGSTRRPGC